MGETEGEGVRGEGTAGRALTHGVLGVRGLRWLSPSGADRLCLYYHAWQAVTDGIVTSQWCKSRAACKKQKRLGSGQKKDAGSQRQRGRRGQNVTLTPPAKRCPQIEHQAARSRSARAGGVPSVVLPLLQA